MEPTEIERRSEYLPERMYPVPRPNNIPRLQRYAPWSKKANKGWALSWSDYAVLPTAGTSKGNRVTPLSQLNDRSAPIDCPWCKTKSETIIRKEMGAVVPCIFDVARDCEHFCGNCGVMVGKHANGSSGSQPVEPQERDPVSQYQQPLNMKYAASDAVAPPPNYEESKAQHGQQVPDTGAADRSTDHTIGPVTDENAATRGERYELSGMPMGSEDKAPSKSGIQGVEAGGAAGHINELEEQSSPVSPPIGSEPDSGMRHSEDHHTEPSNPRVSPILR
ncbi:MAG: hypothetical protein Q9227_005721 [Pyrenula ochraceoflavens]